MRDIGGGDPAFRADDGSADPDLAAALASYGARTGGEFTAIAALSESRLLVPVVAVAADSSGEPGSAGHTAEMALPTLIGRDGRAAVPAFTCLDAMRAWRPEARPVPVRARQVCQAAVEQACAVLVDIAGPVPFVLEGARLAALARGEAAPQMWEDQDVHDAVAAVLTGYPQVASVALGPPAEEHDLAVTLTLAAGIAEAPAQDLVAQAGAAIMTRLGGRLRRGLAIGFGTCCAG